MWIAGRGGGGYPARQCASVTIEECVSVGPRDALPPELSDQQVMKRVGARLQPFLACPQCGPHRRRLYAVAGSAWSCQGCLRLDYASRHQERDPVRRALAIRRGMGAEPAVGG